MATPAEEVKKTVKQSVAEPTVEKPVRNQKSKIKVKNISKNDINLTHGKIESGSVGIATLAELQTLYAHIHEV